MLSNPIDNLVQRYWVLGLVQVIHSIEETLTQLYIKLNAMIEALHESIPSVPLIQINADQFAAINYLLLALILGTVPIVRKGHPMGFVLVWSWAVIELLNGIFHLGTWVGLRTYFPGGISGPILFVLSVFLILQLRSLTNQTTEKIQ